MKNTPDEPIPYQPHRQGLHSDDKPYPGEPMCYCDQPKSVTPSKADEEKTPGGASSHSLTLNTSNYTGDVRQILLDLLTEYQALERPTNPELLKLHIEAYEDKILDLITTTLHKERQEIVAILNSKELHTLVPYSLYELQKAFENGHNKALREVKSIIQQRDTGSKSV